MRRTTVNFSDECSDRLLTWIMENIDKRYVGYQTSTVEIGVNYFLDAVEKDQALNKRMLEAIKKDAEERTALRGRYARR